MFAKQLTLLGPDAVLDAAGSPDGYGIEVVGPGGSGSRIDGWTVMNAQYSGILVGSQIFTQTTPAVPLTDGSPISDVTVDHVTVVHNDQGFAGGVIGLGVGECF